MVVAASWWCFFDALETSAVGIQGHVFWVVISYPGAMTTCTLLLLFALDYTGRRRSPDWVVVALFVVPAIGIGLLAPATPL